VLGGDVNDFRDYDVVRIESLVSAHADTSVSKQLPAVGDTGTIVHTLSADKFIVEGVNADGSTRWLCDFTAVDLALVARGNDA
jgi:hypothetical protein